jgi:hypothetical protein
MPRRNHRGNYDQQSKRGKSQGGVRKRRAATFKGKRSWFDQQERRAA